MPEENIEEPSGADTKAAAEVIKLRERYNALKLEKEALETKLSGVEGEVAKLTRQNEKVASELGVYKASEARKSAVRRALESPDVKGKLDVDEEKVMRYLARGHFDETKLDAEVLEAVEFVGVPISRGSGISDRGVSGDDPTAPKPQHNDPLGSFVSKTLGGR